MILVVGATGTVGAKVIDGLLAKQGKQLRALSRGKSDWKENLFPQYRRQGIDVIVGDARSESTVERAVQGCKAIINCCGIMRETPDNDIESINVQAVENLVKAGKEAGVQRFIQLSCLGATQHSSSDYFYSKWEAEEMVKKSGSYWTIFRPSLIFDQQSPLIRILEFWIERAPLLVMVGSGLNQFQPVSAQDVAESIVQSLYDKTSVGKTYELVGPDVLDLQTLLAMMSEAKNRKLSSIRIPSFIGIPLAGIIGKLNPKSPIDNNVMSVLTSEMLGEDSEMLQKFKVNRLSMQSCLKALPSGSSKSQKADNDDDEESEEDDDEEPV